MHLDIYIHNLNLSTQETNAGESFHPKNLRVQEQPGQYCETQSQNINIGPDASAQRYLSIVHTYGEIK